MKNTEKKNNNSEVSKLKKFCLIKGAVCKKFSRWLKTNKTMVIGILAIMVSFLIGYYVKNTIAATVNGKPIWRARVVKQLEKYQGKSLLDSLVTQELIKQEAKNKGISASKDEIQNQIKELEINMTAQGTNLETALVEQGMTMKDLEENFEMNIIIEKLLTDRITVTDEEIQEYFNQSKDSFGDGATLDQVGEQIKTLLKQQKMGDEYQNFVNELRTKADINIVAKY
jgi:foldase protein PrsA